MRTISHFCNRIEFLILCCILVSCGGATVTSFNWTGKTYYVDATNGNDNNSGISQAAPWKTIAKVNSTSFQPGDSILFKRGDVWRKMLIAPSSGSPGNPITFGAYGTGANPIISGADVWVGFVNGGANIWDLAGVTIEPKVVMINGVLGTKKASRAACTSAGDWFWGSNILSVYSTVDPSGNVEGGQRNAGILLDDRSYITITGISVKLSNMHGISRSGTVGSNIIYDGVTSSYNYWSGLQVKTVSNSAIRNSTATYNCGSGAEFTFVADSTIENNTFTYNAQLPDTPEDNLHGRAGIRLYAIETANNIIQNNNVSYHPNGAGIWLDTCGIGNIVRYNIVSDNNGIGVAGIFNEITSGTKIYYNVVYSNRYGIFISGGSLPGRYPANNNEVYNNTVWGNDSGGFVMHNEDDIQGYCNDNIIKNNIFVNTTNGPEIMVKGGAQNELNTITYNTFGAERLNFIQWGYQFGSTYAVWEGVVGDTHSVKSDPLLVNPSVNNFTLKTVSPCRDAGTNVGPTRDYAGTSVPQGSAPDIGAYEYVPP